MTASELYGIWAPESSQWSRWVKPVIFAHFSDTTQPITLVLPRFDARPGIPFITSAAYLIDLPGLESLNMGLFLAQHGYRPIPVFNACPTPLESIPEVVAARRLLAGLVQGAALLQSLSISANACPAFLLDADRHGIGVAFGPGWFDNRSVVFPTDFPSARFLLAQGIESVVVIHTTDLHADLHDALHQWRSEGLRLMHAAPESLGRPTDLLLPSRSWLARLRQRLWALLHLWRNPEGGYGAYWAEAGGPGGG
jgi:hypothetical protein